MSLEIKQLLVDLATNNETSFFRDPAIFNSVECHMLPETIKRNTAGKKIRIWSAASSTGQEAYSLSILCNEFKGWPSAPHFEILGFDIEKLKFIAPQLPALCERLFMPLLSERAFLPAEWDLAGHFDRILGDNKWWFRMAGPPWFFLLMRSVQGLCWALDKLNVPISIATCWQHATAHLELESQLLKLNLPEKYSEFSTISSFDKFAKHLCIRITENGREKINLSLSVRIVDEIESYLPLETVSEIKEAGENLSEIKLRIQRSGYVPQNVLSKQIDSKKFEVFLV